MTFHERIKSVLVGLSGTRVAIWLRCQMRGSAIGRWGIRNSFRLLIGEYEKDVHHVLMSEIKSGDTIWDIGANVGDYTRLFAEATGPTGSVVAVEPCTASAQCIRDYVASSRFENVRIVEAAMSDKSGTGRLTKTANHTDANNHLTSEIADSAQVAIISGDELFQQEGKCPTIVKIDVEGHEMEVLEGMSKVLKQLALRFVLVEIHFGLLEKRGAKGAAKRIPEMLRNAGLNTRWVDFSHLVGSRKSIGCDRLSSP